MYAKEFLIMTLRLTNCTYLVGCEETDNSHDRLQGPHKILSIEEDTAQTVELLRPGSPIRLRPGSCTWSREPGGGLFVQNRHQPSGPDPPQLHDEIYTCNQS